MLLLFITAALVIPTNEELLIARDTVRCVKDAPRRW
jgi:acetate kinase